MLFERVYRIHRYQACWETIPKLRSFGLKWIGGAFKNPGWRTYGLHPVQGFKRSLKYWGAWPHRTLSVSTRILKLILKLTRRQCKEVDVCVICDHVLACAGNLAAAFWTVCNEDLFMPMRRALQEPQREELALASQLRVLIQLNKICLCSWDEKSMSRSVSCSTLAYRFDRKYMKSWTLFWLQDVFSVIEGLFMVTKGHVTQCSSVAHWSVFNSFWTPVELCDIKDFGQTDYLLIE